MPTLLTQKRRFYEQLQTVKPKSRGEYPSGEVDLGQSGLSNHFVRDDSTGQERADDRAKYRSPA